MLLIFFHNQSGFGNCWMQMVTTDLKLILARSSLDLGKIVTSPYDQRNFWKMLKNSFKNDVAQEGAFTKYHPAKKHKGTKRGQPREAEERKERVWSRISVFRQPMR